MPNSGTPFHLNLPSDGGSGVGDTFSAVVDVHKKKKHSWGGFFDNLGSSAVNNLEGLGKGLVIDLPHALFNDALQAVEVMPYNLTFGAIGDSPQSINKRFAKSVTLENMGKGLYHHVVDKGTFWGELGRTHFGKAWDAFYKDPLGPVLDVAGLFTGGAGAVGKAGEAAAFAGDASRVGSLAKFARAAHIDPASGFARKLAKFGGYEPATAENIDRALRAGAGKAGLALMPPKVGIGPEAVAYAPKVAQIGERAMAAGKLSDAHATATFRLLSRNPLIRLRQLALHGLSERLGAAAPALPVVGADARVARVGRAAAERSKRELMAPVARTRVALSRLSPTQRVAVVINHIGTTPEEFVGHYRTLLAQASSPAERAMYETRIAQIEHAAKAFHQPTLKMRKATEAMRSLADRHMASVAKDLNIATGEDRAYRALRIIRGARPTTKVVTSTGREMTLEEAQAALAKAENFTKHGFRNEANKGIKAQLRADFNPAAGTGRVVVDGGAAMRNQALHGGEDLSYLLNSASSAKGALGRKAASATASAEETLWHYLEQYAGGGVPAEPGPRLNRMTMGTGEHITQRALATIFENRGLSRDQAAKLIRARDVSGELRQAIVSHEDPFADPNSPFYDPTAAMTKQPLPQTVDTTVQQLKTPVVTGGPSVEALKAEGRQASYFPMTADSARVSRFGTRDNPLKAGMPGKSFGARKYATGANLLSGRMTLDPFALTRRAEALVNLKDRVDRYQFAISHGTPMRLGDVPAGYVAYDPKGLVTERTLESTRAVLSIASELAHDHPKVAAALKQAEHDMLVKVGDKSVDGQTLTEHSPVVAVPERLHATLFAGTHAPTGAIGAVLHGRDQFLHAWKAFVLPLTGRFTANNLVTQNLMLALHGVGPRVVADYARLVREHAGDAAGHYFLRYALRHPEDSTRLLDTVFEQAAGLSLAGLHSSERGSFTNAGALSGMARTRTLFRRAVDRARRVPEAINEVSSVLTDDLPRQVRFLQLVRPHVLTAMRRDPQLAQMGFARAAAKILHDDPALRDRLTQQTMRDLVDFVSMTPAERQVVRKMVPFYGWLRGMNAWAVRAMLDRPLMSAGLYELGRQGADALTAAGLGAGQVPTTIFGAVPNGQPHNGIAPVLTMKGFNPFSTNADEIRMLQALLEHRPVNAPSDNSIASVIAPDVNAAAILATGKDLQGFAPQWFWNNDQTAQQNRVRKLFGLPTQKQQGLNRLEGAVASIIGSIPQTQLARNTLVFNGSQPGSVYSSPSLDYIMSYMGVPIRHVNLATARQKRRKEQGLSTAAPRII